VPGLTMNQGATRSSLFTSDIVGTRRPSTLSAAPSPSLMGKALFYAPVTPTTPSLPTRKASMPSAFTGKAEGNPIAPTPTSPKAPRSIPPQATASGRYRNLRGTMAVINDYGSSGSTLNYHAPSECNAYVIEHSPDGMNPRSTLGTATGLWWRRVWPPSRFAFRVHSLR
jgi:hypothetical protein